MVVPNVEGGQRRTNLNTLESMKYMRLNSIERKELLESLAGMPQYLEGCFAGLSQSEISSPGPGGSFSPVEQVWHLADLEREGFGIRIRRLISEPNPRLPDFEGGRLAVERG